ncbi:molybdate ABC transporter permease subunit [Xanthovirga aplysinae]|uniref:molybdate ABC transporter permease subunit n=1 Tax=Xanthovirga aplysinae TaxID=2529853 RepID=UPI0012BB5AE5|nr:molybdate ABC transporter permease subunit [Xanthovirga aplysinae]MTI33484.1 molybdate ABC transporter permease subunit [Xanthovirga aplysinae]
MQYDWNPIFLSFKLAFVSTGLLLLFGLPMAYLLVFWKGRFKFLLEAIFSLPLVLPPSVLGFYLLLALAPTSFLGSVFQQYFGFQLAFSFSGLVVASMIYTFPFMLQPIQAGLQKLPSSLTEAAFSLGSGKLQTFRKVLLPNIKPALLTACVLSFAHGIGEFGLVLMIGGNIPGKTRLASLAIFDEMEALNYDTAGFYSMILLSISFLVLAMVYFFNRRQEVWLR